MKQKGLAPILIILLIALAVGGYFIYQKQPKPVSQSQSSPSPAVSSSDETIDTEASRSANWKTYTNTKYSYSIKYPKTLPLNTTDQTSSVISLNKQIFITTEDINKPICQGDCDTETIQKTENVRVNQLDAKKYIGIKDLSRMAGYSPPQSFIRYELIRGNYKFKLEIIELENLKHSYEEEKLYPPDRVIQKIPDDKLQVFNQIISTFKFTQ